MKRRIHEGNCGPTIRFPGNMRSAIGKSFPTRLVNAMNNFGFDSFYYKRESLVSGITNARTPYPTRIRCDSTQDATLAD